VPNVRPRGVRTIAFALTAVALLLTAAPSIPSARGASPPLPVKSDRQFVGNLSAPSIAPGGTGSLRFSLTDPSLFGAALSSVRLTFEVYAFNGFPANGSAAVPVANAPLLSNATTSGATVGFGVGSLASGHTVTGSIGIATSSATPTGAFAIRTALAFTLNATAYRLESRGWFSAATWAAATHELNGSATLNLSVLGVSGVLPETAVLVSSSDWQWALGALLAGAFVLLAAGAWVYARRGPGSTGGAG